ncbi:hypothetical protein FBU30_007096 [Linnemannia zychae]|nr:hypothetical protein FBU30_007096 [Linnemannia zychae]
MHEQHNRNIPTPQSPQYDELTDTDSEIEGSSSGKPTKTKSKANSASKKHLTHDHFDFMLDWLERSGNYTRIFGINGKTTIGGKDNKSANVAFQENENSTGYGLTEKDYTEHIRTLAQKYEKECYRFERMDKIFGQKPNINALASMEGGLGTTLKIQGMSVAVDLFNDGDGDGDDDDLTVISQNEILGAISDNNSVVTPAQDENDVGNDPLENEDEQASPSHRKRTGSENSRNKHDKRQKMNAARIPPPRVNTGSLQDKKSSFSTQLFENMTATTQLKMDMEQKKLDWDKEKWNKEYELRKEEINAESKNKRLAIIAALLQQGITDKDIILSIVDS